MESHAGAVFRFANFEMDCARRVLIRDGEPLRLKPKTFDLLRELVENRGSVITKDELLTSVWPGTAEEISDSLFARVRAAGAGAR